MKNIKRSSPRRVFPANSYSNYCNVKLWGRTYISTIIILIEVGDRQSKITSSGATSFLWHSKGSFGLMWQAEVNSLPSIRCQQQARSKTGCRIPRTVLLLINCNIINFDPDPSSHSFRLLYRLAACRVVCAPDCSNATGEVENIARSRKCRWAWWKISSGLRSNSLPIPTVVCNDPSRNLIIILWWSWMVYLPWQLPNNFLMPLRSEPIECDICVPGGYTKSWFMKIKSLRGLQ